MIKNAFWAVLLLFCLPLTVRATEDYEYTLREDAVLITQYLGTDTEVTVPATMTVDGTEYPVILEGRTVFANNTQITSVTLEPGVQFEDGDLYGLFQNCTQLQSVRMQDLTGLTDMTGVFYRCENLTDVELSGLDTSGVTNINYLFSGCTSLKNLSGYRDWDTGSVESMYMAFHHTDSLSFIDLSGWDLSQVKDTGWCFQHSGASQILLPDSLNILSAGFFNHANGYRDEIFTVPAGVTAVGLGHTFYDFGTGVTEFAVASGNSACKAVDGILYSRDGSILYAIPGQKEFADGVYTVPEGVTMMGELSFGRNESIREVVLPDSYEITQVATGDPRYVLQEDNGNLNSGNSLNIAVYLNTGVTRYSVKETNPRYTSVDGILYSVDGSALVAVPSRYEGEIRIPEGVIRWESEALWSVANDAANAYLENLTGVFIPESLTYIASDQLRKLNSLLDQGVTITVAEGNPAYGVNWMGALVNRDELFDGQGKPDFLWHIPVILGSVLLMTLATVFCFRCRRKK